MFNRNKNEDVLRSYPPPPAPRPLFERYPGKETLRVYKPGLVETYIVGVNGCMKLDTVDDIGVCIIENAFGVIRYSGMPYEHFKPVKNA